MTNSPAPKSFDDVNEAVVAEWKAETTPYQRVREVISHRYTPVSAETVADTARTAPKTARKHLEGLSEEGFVTTEPGDSGGTHYRRSPESLVVEQAADILERVSIEELTDRIREMREELETYRSEYGVESPADLTVEVTTHELAGTTEDIPDIDPEDRQQWQTTRRNLAFANAALAIANAESFVDGETDAVGESTATQ